MDVLGDMNNWRVLSNEKVGRYVVAGRDLEPSEIILSEIPFVYGPKADTPPLCLGCFAPADGSTLCTECGWPVCDQTCEQIPSHRNAECKVFRLARVRFQPVDDPTEPCPQYECITQLRLFIAKETNPERWETDVKSMETHNEIRRAQPIWKLNQTNVVDYLLGPCQLQSHGTCDADLLHTICGILEINSFEGRTIAGYAFRALYPKLAMMSHNCVSNTTHCIMPANGDEYRMYVRAAVYVPEGGELFASYTHSLLPTMLRREYLKWSKFFDCECARCSDPMELGTHMSTLKCTKCDNGIVLSTNSLDCTAGWKCTHCEYSARGDTIRRVLLTIQSELDEVEASESGQYSQGIEEREKIFRKYRSVLHPRHSFMTMLRHSLSQMYGRMDAYLLEDLPDVLLERKVDLCRDLLKVLDVIEPGHSRIRGMTLYELHAPLILLARNLQRAGVIDKKGLRAKLEEAMKYLEESAAILSLEPKLSSEGIIGQVAVQSLQQLKDNLDSLIEQADN